MGRVLPPTIRPDDPRWQLSIACSAEKRSDSMDMTSWLVTSEDRLRETVGDLPPRTRDKVKPALDDHSMRFIAASPYVCVGTTDGNGRMDVSPRGDEMGFVQVLDSSTIVIPERPGNRLADTLTNVLRHPFIGLLFL